MIHLYAFALGLRDLDDAALDAVPLENVSAVVGRDEPDPLRHGLVVQALLERADSVLPARFGERFEDEPALLTAVAPRLPELEQRLRHVAGCVEISVRATWAREPPADGASYLRERLRETDLHRTLAGRARDSVRTGADTAYLVEREGVDDFARAVEELLAGRSDLDAVCTGPWAPFSFGSAA